MDPTAATLFSGGGGADIGLSAAGFDVLWGIENDNDIARVARENGLNIYTADVTQEDPNEYSDVDVLHASPPCPNFSVAKTGGEETDEDVSLADATARFIRGISPGLFTLENVWGYRKSRSWQLIRNCLTAEGYDWNAWRLNAANWGVPQTRKRMIVCARKGGPRPKKPPSTHAEDPQEGGLFGDDLNEWIGWHEAVEDLIPDLPETQLADWQKERLPDELTQTQMIAAASADYANKNRPPERPHYTVEAKPKGGAPRAIICDTQPNARGDNREGQEPTKTVAADPAGGAPRAVLVSNANTQWGDGTHKGEDPSLTVTDQHGGRLRAVLVNATSNMQIASADHLAYGQVARVRSFQQRAVMGRRVVQMTPRALARFQTFPDWYDLPDSKSLACRIIGNAVPPLAMKKWLLNWG
jgi:DNA (cytosine-5)-methyltransferase 1